MTRIADLDRRIARLEDDTHTEGERPPELTIEEKEALAERFDVDPWDSR